MGDFEKWFKDQDFYTNMRFIHGDRLFDKDGDVYWVLPVQIAYQGWNARQSEIDELKAQLECCRKENAVLLGRVGELEKNEFLLARVKTILGCEKKTNLLESIIVRDLRKVLRGEHETN